MMFSLPPPLNYTGYHLRIICTQLTLTLCVIIEPFNLLSRTLCGSRTLDDSNVVHHCPRYSQFLSGFPRRPHPHLPSPCRNSFPILSRPVPLYFLPVRSVLLIPPRYSRRSCTSPSYFPSTSLQFPRLYPTSSLTFLDLSCFTCRLGTRTRRGRLTRTRCKRQITDTVTPSLTTDRGLIDVDTHRYSESRLGTLHSLKTHHWNFPF